MWYEKAVAQGHAMAQYNLGCLHCDGRGGPQNFTRTRELFELAAIQGQPEAMVNIGGMFVNGQGVQQDLNEACDGFPRPKLMG